MSTSTDETSAVEYDYVVVGSGAGGGTVAARLAEKDFRVLLLEAGGDPIELKGGDPAYPNKNRLPDDYQVPVFHAFASENEALSWEFFVRHYKDNALQQRDKQCYRQNHGGKIVDGVLYPRAGTLGGCTAHNAMITVYPHNDDWHFIEMLTGDSSWNPENMRRYFQRMENCHHRPGWRLLEWVTGINPTRHGFRGWLSTEKAIPKAAVKSRSLKNLIIDTVAAELRDADQDVRTPLLERLRWILFGKGDPNDWRLVKANSTGLRYTPLATSNHSRMGSRERVLDVKKRRPEKLVVELDALATRVVFDKKNNRAIGVEYLKGTRLYRAHKNPSDKPGEKRTVYVKREVILAGGAYNTPQLLMLSGIGPQTELSKHGIPVRVDLPGVGSNLQDRYEVGVVNRMAFREWDILKGAEFQAGDPQYIQWNRRRRSGVYTTNGAVAAIARRSDPTRSLPDLFIFALVGLFKGYFPGYSSLFKGNLNYLTWCILKAHTQNSAGTVRLRTADPIDTPLINFAYFSESNDHRGDDLKAMVEGVRFVRKLTEPLRRKGLIDEEEVPGDAVVTDAQIEQFVQDSAWGHHASCSCPIGRPEQGGVVNGNFEVHGTKGLRIVDASVFPKIPGFFIVTSVYMIGEKAADVIAAAAGR
jgi:choline dehydrogenase-like flavoprotein